MPEHVRYKLDMEIEPHSEFSVRGNTPVKLLIMSEMDYAQYRDGLPYDCVEFLITEQYGIAAPVSTDRAGLDNVVLEPLDCDDYPAFFDLELRRDF